jgi:hypothetical protein
MTSVLFTGKEHMGLLELLSQAFINFFGITQPDSKGKRRATLFICGLLSLLVLIPGLVLWIVHARSPKHF